MKKNVKIIILVAIVIIIGVICGIVYNRSQKEVETNSENEIENIIEETNTTHKNSEVENVVQEEVKEEIENTVEETNAAEENEKEAEVEEEKTFPEDYKPEASSTNNKEEAIKLVKEKWGEDDSVKFRCDSVTSDGEYIIAVISKSTAKVQNYFRVNLKEKAVYVHY